MLYFFQHPAPLQRQETHAHLGTGNLSAPQGSQQVTRSIVQVSLVAPGVSGSVICHLYSNGGVLDTQGFILILFVYLL